MGDKFIPKCGICHGAIGKPYISLDRRTQMRSTDLWQGSPRPTLKVLQAQELFRYDSQECRSSHEPAIVAELQLQATYPAGGQFVPCSRCAAPVNRNLPHASYTFLEVEMEDWTVTKVIADTELAVLCAECEEPDTPTEQAAAAVAIEQESSRT